MDDPNRARIETRWEKKREHGGTVRFVDAILLFYRWRTFSHKVLTTCDHTCTLSNCSVVWAHHLGRWAAQKKKHRTRNVSMFRLMAIQPRLLRFGMFACVWRITEHGPENHNYYFPFIENDVASSIGMCVCEATKKLPHQRELYENQRWRKN